MHVESVSLPVALSCCRQDNLLQNELQRASSKEEYMGCRGLESLQMYNPGKFVFSFVFLCPGLWNIH